MSWEGLEKPVGEIETAFEAKRAFLEVVEKIEGVKARVMHSTVPVEQWGEEAVKSVYDELMSLYVRLERLDDHIEALQGANGE